MRHNLRRWILGASGVLAAIAATSVLWASARSHRPALPERAVDMWGVEYDLTAKGWTLLDFAHVSGCGYCVLNAAAYQQNFGDALAGNGGRTFGVDVFECQRDLVDYVKHHGLRFPILTEPDILWTACPGIPGQSLFRDGRRVWGKSETITLRNYDRLRRSVEGLPPYRPSGPLKKAINSVFEDERALVVVGDDIEPDAAQLFSGLRRTVFDIERASDVTEADLDTGSLYVIGSPAGNRFMERLSGKTPFAVSHRRIAFADTVVTGDDLLLWYCVPNPWNPEHYLVVKTGTAPSSMRGHYYEGSQDFTIARRVGADVIPIATGICDKSGENWSLSAHDVVWMDGTGAPTSDAAECGPQGCEAPVPAASLSPSGRYGRKAEPTMTNTPRVAFDWTAEGRFIALSALDDGACWAAWDRPGVGVMAGRVGSDGSQPVRLCAGDPTSVDAIKPAVFALSPDSAWVAWSERVGEAWGIYAAHLDGSGVPELWRVSHHRNLDHHGPALALDDGGRVSVAWYMWQANARIPFARSWNGAKWSEIRAIPTADDSRFAWYLSGTRVDGDTRFVWMQHYPDPTCIVTATESAGRWSPPRVLARAGRYPTVAYDPATKSSRVVWQQWDRGNSTNDHFAWSIMTSVEDGGRWSNPSPIPRCPDGRNETPVVCVDGSGNTWVFWCHKDRPDNTAAHWRVMCEVLDGGKWRGPYAVSDAGVDARSPAVTSNGDVWAGWHEGTGRDLRIRIRRIRPWNAPHGETVGMSWPTREATKN